jgi:hypothetical protein
MVAICSGSIDVVKHIILVTEKARELGIGRTALNDIDGLGLSPLSIAVSQTPDMEMFKLLIEACAPTTPEITDGAGRTKILHGTARVYGDLSFLKEMIKIGSDMTELDARGLTVLDYATLSAHRCYIGCRTGPAEISLPCKMQ